jgi:polyribonucleotide nucleotidyltransferase
MKILLAAALATMIVAPCMAKDDEDKTQSDVQIPGVTEPRVPDTMKTAPAARIQSEERASERAIQEDRTVGEKDRRIDEKKDDGRK